MHDSFDMGYAVVIGTGASGAESSATDATAVTNILLDKQRCAFKEANVRSLVGAAATRDAILDALETIGHAAASHPDSTVVFFFSGHGLFVETQGQGHTAQGQGQTEHFLLPANVLPGTIQQADPATTVSGTRLTDWVAQLNTEHVLILLDCCQPGGLEIIGGGGVHSKPAPFPKELASLNVSTGRVVLASSKENEFSLPGQPYSRFTAALIQALCGADVAQTDGFVRMSDIFRHVTTSVPATTGDFQHPQMFAIGIEDFPVAYYAGSSKQPIAWPPELATMQGPPHTDWRRLEVGVANDRSTVRLHVRVKAQPSEWAEQLAKSLDLTQPPTVAASAGAPPSAYELVYKGQPLSDGSALPTQGVKAEDLRLVASA